jgi:hypothetical protein
MHSCSTSPLPAPAPTQAAGLDSLVEWNHKREVDAKVAELQDGIAKILAASEEAGATEAAELLAYIKGRKEEGALPDTDVLRVTWTALVNSLNMTGEQRGGWDRACMPVRTAQLLYSPCSICTLLLHCGLPGTCACAAISPAHCLTSSCCGVKALTEPCHCCACQQRALL